MNPTVVGLFGGSFDPVHRGHVEIARRACEQVPLDAVWFLPAGVAPNKPEGPTASARDRIDLLEVAIAGDPRLLVCDDEVDDPGRRAVDTLDRLRARHPDVRWHWIMGEDAFRSLPEWVEPRRLVEMAPPVVQPRPGADGERPTRFEGATVFWLEGEPLDVSSTAVREALARGGRPDAIDEVVYEIIRGRGLYGV